MGLSGKSPLPPITIHQLKLLSQFTISIDPNGKTLYLDPSLAKKQLHWSLDFLQDFDVIDPPVSTIEELTTLSNSTIGVRTRQTKLDLHGILVWSDNVGYLFLKAPDRTIENVHRYQEEGPFDPGRTINLSEDTIILQSLLDYSSDAIQIADEEGRLLFVNQEASQRLGIKKSHCRRYYVSDFEKSFKKPGTWQQHVQDLANKEILTLEGININQSTGHSFPVEVTVKLVNINGKRYVVANSRDISERKKFQTELDHILKLQEALVDIASAYITFEGSNIESTLSYAVEKMGKYLKAEKACIFEYEFERNVAQNVFEMQISSRKVISSPKEIPLTQLQSWISAHQSGQPMVITNAEDHPRDCPLNLINNRTESLVTVPMIRGGELNGFIAFKLPNPKLRYSEREKELLSLFGLMLISIRKRENQVKTLRLHEEKYRNLIANMNLGLLEVDNGDYIRFANQSFCNLSGLNLDELIGNRALDVLPVADKNKLRTKTAERQQGVSDSYEVEYISKTGERRFWLISGAANFNDEGRHIGSIGVHLDITNIKEMEIELEKARRLTEAASKAKDLFLANMSHEIRTPLNVILGMIRMLSNETLSDHQHSLISQASSSAKHLLTILNNVLDIAKIESGKLDLELDRASISSIVNNAESILSSHAVENETDLVVNIDKSIHPILKVDSTRLKQVLLNLLGNAIKFTHQGQVQINVHVVDDQDDSQTLQFTIKDNGIGMSEEFLSQIFDKFSQEQNHASRKFEGTGLGMAISADLLKLMGGTLLVESKKGVGSTFWFDLTLEKSHLDLPVNIVPGTHDPSFEGKVVLLVEDNKMNRFIARHSLEIMRFTVLEAQNGKEAIEILDKNTCDIILMDVQMPVMDGLEATRIIRKKWGYRTPIIALTANAFRHDIELYLNLGMDDCITKPYDERDFQQKISKILSFPIDPGSKNEEKMQERRAGTYDLSELHTMVEGDHQFLIEMIEVFVETTSVECHLIRQTLEDRNFADIAKIAHKIKPNLKLMGLEQILEDVLKLERHPIDNEESISALATDVCDRLEEVIAQIKIDHLVLPSR